jgi:hypothetical protein
VTLGGRTRLLGVVTNRDNDTTRVGEEKANGIHSLDETASNFLSFAREQNGIYLRLPGPGEREAG